MSTGSSAYSVHKVLSRFSFSSGWTQWDFVPLLSSSSRSTKAYARHWKVSGSRDARSVLAEWSAVCFARLCSSCRRKYSMEELGIAALRNKSADIFSHPIVTDRTCSVYQMQFQYQIKKLIVDTDLYLSYLLKRRSVIFSRRMWSIRWSYLPSRTTLEAVQVRCMENATVLAQPLTTKIEQGEECVSSSWTRTRLLTAFIPNLKVERYRQDLHHDKCSLLGSQSKEWRGVLKTWDLLKCDPLHNQNLYYTNCEHRTSYHYPYQVAYFIILLLSPQASYNVFISLNSFQ